MRIHTHLTQQLETTGGAVKGTRSPTERGAARLLGADSLTISEGAALLDAMARASATPEREAKLELLQGAYSAGQLHVDPATTAATAVWRGFDRVQS